MRSVKIMKISQPEIPISLHAYAASPTNVLYADANVLHNKSFENRKLYNSELIESKLEHVNFQSTQLSGATIRDGVFPAGWPSPGLC